MDDGRVVIWGKDSVYSAPQFHVFNSYGERHKTLDALCQHWSINILSLKINGTQYLAVSCMDCHKIRLYDTATKDVHVAFSDSFYRPGKMVLGPPGTLYSSHISLGIDSVFEYDCTSIHFKKGDLIRDSVLDRLSDICYIPTMDALVLCSSTSSLVRAISCKTKNVLWELSGNIDNLPMKHSRMVYSDMLDTLFITNIIDGYTFVTEPINGSHMQTLRRHFVFEASSNRDQLIMLYQDSDSILKISYFTVSISFIFSSYSH